MEFSFDFMGNRFGPIGNSSPLCFMAGPCVIESRAHALEVASALKEIFDSHRVPFIFKSSFDKANRSSGGSWRGPGMVKGLDILAQVRESLRVPIITDIHLPSQAKPVAEVADILQIPAFLCRQTDLILSAAGTGKPLNIKKGQFVAPWQMKNVVAKARAAGNERICLCERGTSFGYGDLVVDMRGLEVMKSMAPVVLDATHSVQRPGALGTASGGERAFVPVLARAGVAIGIAGLFLEVHPDPDHAPCDGPNMLPLCDLPTFLERMTALDTLVKTFTAPPLPNCNVRHISSSTPRLHEEGRLLTRLEKICVIITDVDGVLTDGGLYYNDTGECIKKFSVRDGLAVKMLRDIGIEIAVISGRDSPALRARLADLSIKHFALGVTDKKNAFFNLLPQLMCPADNTAYIGDDLPDLDVFPHCGLSITVGDAPEYMKSKAELVLSRSGGSGVLRELADLICDGRSIY